MIIISDEDTEKETEKETGDEIERGRGVGQGERNRERGRNGKHFFVGLFNFFTLSRMSILGEDFPNCFTPRLSSTNLRFFF